MSSKSKKKRQVDTSDSDSGPDSDPPPQKKPAAKPDKKKGGSASKSNDNDENDNDKMFPLSKQRFISVSEFRGRPLINIREYYNDAAGDQKPGKKGISLSVEQWKALKDHMGSIDEILERIS